MPAHRPATAHRPPTEGVLCQLSGQSDPWVLCSHVVPPDVRAMSWDKAARERDRIDRACRMRGLAWDDVCCYYRQLVQHVTNLTLDAYHSPTVAELEARSWWDAMNRARTTRRGGLPPRDYDHDWERGYWDTYKKDYTPDHYIGDGVWGISGGNK